MEDEQLIKLIYDGVQDDSAWGLALSKVAELVRATGASEPFLALRIRRRNVPPPISGLVFFREHDGLSALSGHRYPKTTKPGGGRRN